MSGRGDLAGQTVQRYQEVIDGVVARVKPEFAQEGIDESVLDEVRALWEAKLVATGVVGEPNSEGQQVIQQQQPAAARPGVVPPTLAQQQQFLAMRPGFPPGVLPMGVPPHMLAGAAAGSAQQQQQLQVAAFLQAQQAMMAAQAAQAAAAAAQQKRKLEDGSPAPDAKRTIPQQDGTADDGAAVRAERDHVAALRRKLQRTIPQQDGPADDAGGDGGGGGGEEGGEAAAEGEAAADDDDDPLTEDDEASGDDVDEAALTDVVLGQFEKVQRSKAKWRVVLKDCVLTLGGRDYLVHRATGEFDFL